MSSKIKLVYILIGILLLLASVKAGMALQEDFNAYATENTIYTCSCALTQDNVVVENTGDVTSTYSIVQTGTGAEFSSLTENAFNLKPGESKTINNFVRAPCGVTGDYDLKTEFETVFGLKKEFVQKVTIKDCVNVNLMMLEVALPVCPCSPAKYTFRVENTGTFLETYKLEIDSDYAELSEDILILEPQHGENVTIFITTPCGSYGDLEFTLMALAESSDMIAELPFVLRVAPCYNYTMGASAQYSVCQELNNIVPINVRNLADVSNTYFLNVNADWAIFENSSINLWGGEETTANLNVYPIDVEPANYNLTIDAVTARGEIRKTLNVAVNVENCYSLNLSTESDYAQVVNGEKGSVKVKVENNGARSSEYSLNLTGPEWTSLDLGRVGLDPGTGKEIKVEYGVPVNVTGRYEILVSANIVDHPEKVRYVGMTLDTVSVEDAYRVDIDTPLKKLESNYDGGAIPIIITNTGIRKGEYTLSFYGNNWTSLNTSKITIEPQQSSGIGIKLNPIVNVTTEGTYTATIDAVLKDSNIAYSRTFDIKLREKTLWEKISGFFGNYWLYLLIGLLGLLILLGAIIGAVVYRKKHPKKEKKVKEEKFIDKEKPGWLKRILLLLLVLLLLAGIGLAAYYFAFVPLFGNMTNATNMTDVEPIPEPEPVPEPEPITEATIFVNRTGLRGYGNVIEVVGLENITIPLIIQNSDEPNTYIIRVNENISWIKTDKSIVNIPPNKRETVYIFVTPTPEVEEGNYNLSVNINIAGREKPISEEIVLSIKEKEPFYKSYLWYILGGIFVLIVLLVLLKRREKGDEEFEELETVKRKKEKKPADYSKIKNFLVILILVMIALALIGSMIYAGLMIIPSMIKADNATMNATEEVPIEEPEAQEEEEPVEEEEEMPEEDIPEEEYEKVFVKKGTDTLIPIKITNVNKTTTFRIRVKEDVDWLYVENETVEVAPNENKSINLVASPNATVEDGNYKVSVDIDIAEGEKVFSKYFVLKVRKSRFNDLWSYLYYVLAGLVVLFVLMKILGREGKITEEKPEKKEKKAKKKKTSIKLK